MPKTEKDLMLAIAERIDGARGKRMCEKICSNLPHPLDRLLENRLPDREFDAQLLAIFSEIERFGRFASLPPLFGEIEQTAEKHPPWALPN